MSSGLSLLGSGLAVTEETSGSSVTIGVGTTAISGGTSGRVLYDNGGVVGELATTGSGSVVRATSPSLTTPLIAGGTWAAIPAATTSGMLYYASDVGIGGTLLRANGTRWKPLNGYGLLSTLDTPSANINASNTLVYSYQLPAALWQVADTIRMTLYMTKSGTTDTGVLIIKVGTSGTTADTNVTNNTVMTATQLNCGIMVDIKLIDATTVQPLPRKDLGIGGSTTGAIPPSITVSNVSNALYVSACINGGSSNSVAMMSGNIELICSAN